MVFVTRVVLSDVVVFLLVVIGAVVVELVVIGIVVVEVVVIGIVVVDVVVIGVVVGVQKGLFQSQTASQTSVGWSKRSESPWQNQGSAIVWDETEIPVPGWDRAGMSFLELPRSGTGPG